MNRLGYIVPTIHSIQTIQISQIEDCQPELSLVHQLCQKRSNRIGIVNGLIWQIDKAIPAGEFFEKIRVPVKTFQSERPETVLFDGRLR